MNVLLAGATGLVGGLVLDRLGEESAVASVTTISRQPIPARYPVHRAISAQPEHWSAELAGTAFDIAICCLGTTIKAAGSKDAFAAVDLHLLQDFARAAKAAGARQFLMVSSVGADAGSSNFYLSVKGRAEAGVGAVGFERLDIFRPGLLLGRRSGPARIAERLAMALSPLTDALTPAVLSRYRSIRAETVANAIVGRLAARPGGTCVHHNDEMNMGQSETD